MFDRMDHSMTVHEGLPRTRAAEGNIVQGHGELRPEHVCLRYKLMVFAATEFERLFGAVDSASRFSPPRVELGRYQTRGSLCHVKHKSEESMHRGATAC